MMLLLLLLTGCGEVEFLANPPEAKDEEPHVYVNEPQMVMYQLGATDKVITAREGIFLEVSQRLELKDVEIDIYDSGTPAVKLSANQGQLFLQDNDEMNRKKNDFLLTDNVIYKNVDGSVFKTDSLVWIDGEEKFVSDAPFYMEQHTDKGTLVVEGTRLETDKKLKTWKKEGAKITLIPKD